MLVDHLEALHITRAAQRPHAAAAAAKGDGEARGHRVERALRGLGGEAVAVVAVHALAGLGALAACIIKGAERVLPTLGFQLRGLEVKLHAVRQDSPPKILSIDYVITVDTDEPDNRIELLHTNIRKYGTISNTLALAVPIAGRIVRKA